MAKQFGAQRDEQTELAKRHATQAKFYQKGLGHIKTEKGSYMIHLGNTKEELKELQKNYRTLDRKYNCLQEHCAMKSEELQIMEAEREEKLAEMLATIAKKSDEIFDLDVELTEKRKELAEMKAKLAVMDEKSVELKKLKSEHAAMKEFQKKSSHLGSIH